MLFEINGLIFELLRLLPALLDNYLVQYLLGLVCLEQFKQLSSYLKQFACHAVAHECAGVELSTHKIFLTNDGSRTKNSQILLARNVYYLCQLGCKDIDPRLNIEYRLNRAMISFVFAKGPRQRKIALKHDVDKLDWVSLRVDSLLPAELNFVQHVNKLEHGSFFHSSEGRDIQ